MIKKTQIIIALLFLFIVSNNIDSNAQSNLSGDFQVKGFHLDLRIQVMTPQALRDFAKELSGFGINTLIVEWEASYPYQKHAVISNNLAYTRNDIASFIVTGKQLTY